MSVAIDSKTNYMYVADRDESAQKSEVYKYHLSVKKDVNTS